MNWPFPWKFERERYPDYYLMRCVTETLAQRNILELLHSFSVDAVAIDAGGRRQRGRMIAAAAAAGVALSGIQNAKTGKAVPKGFADLEATLAPVGRALYIEVKAPAWLDDRGRVSRSAGCATQEQLEFLLSKWQRGAAVMVAWSATDVQKFLGEELKQNHRAALAFERVSA